jgi:hypothetical protein
MKLVVLADIYGKTKYLEKLVKCLSYKYSSIDIIDPYESLKITFLNEADAYSYFQKNCGIDNYIDKLYQYLKVQQNNKYHLLGFSIGASVVWAVSEIYQFNEKVKAICFYGSQIRNFLHIQPNIEIDLYFAKRELNLNTNEIINTLMKKTKVNCFKTNYLHGFMNHESKNYNENGYTKYIEILKNV